MKIGFRENFPIYCNSWIYILENILVTTMLTEVS